MEDCKKEKYINISPSPVSLEGTEKILDQMNNCVCRIYNNGKGTGFFTRIPFNNDLLPVLITNNHVIGVNDLENKKIITIYLNNDKKMKVIEMDEKRLRYTNKKLDITIIEIKEKKDKLKNNYIELDNNIIDYFKSNENIKCDYLNDIYCHESIYSINYPEDKDIVVSYGQPPKIKKSEINHKCCTKPGSSGSPILLINNQKLIGIHCGSSCYYEFNKGSLIIYSIIEFQKDNNNLYIVNEERKEINDNENKINNFIVAEIDIKEDDQEERIINSYEQWHKDYSYNEYEKESENEKEIKENCEIRINNNKVSFCYSYKFSKRGKYNILYSFKKHITNLNYMFCGCSSLTILNLSNFNTNNVTNMSHMFGGCHSLTNLNLSNFNTNNVINMGGMFSGCSSLTNLNLSNFNTNNVTNMCFIFEGCPSLTSLNLSNFNTNNVINMGGMFSGCSSLANLNLSNFNTNNVIDMGRMFEGCSLLKKSNVIVYDKEILKRLGYL